MTEPGPLLGAKLLPPAPGAFHLKRPRLEDRLRAGLEGRATAVLAGPGYGKTSLVAGFLRDLGGDTVWYSLDASDRDPWIFFRYLTQGLREHAPEFGERTDVLWRDLRSRSDEVEHLADIFLSDAEESLGGRFVVVLDEIHQLDRSPLCLRALKRVLAYLPGTLHLVLVGRSLPEVGLKALSAGGVATIIQADELRFTLDEARTLLLETLGLPMRQETVAKVHARTRGWVTALQLLRQTARLEKDVPDLPEEVFVKTEAEIFDYFSEEVLASEAEDVREFLLASSVPSMMDPDICAEVLKDLDVRRILAGLLKRKLFISPLESRGEYYAYDPIFLDFLRRKLRAERNPEVRFRLERGFGEAFARRRDFPQALLHLVASEEVKLTTELLSRHGKSLLSAGLLEPVKDAAQFLARRGVRSPAIDDLLGEASRLAGDYAAAVGHFNTALAGGGKGSPRLAGTARASTLQGLAYALLKTGETARAAETAEQALAEAAGGDAALVARILNTLSIVRYRENRFTEALAGWQEALARARQAGDEHLILMIAHNLGLPHAVTGDFHRASECFRILTGPGNTRVGPEEGAAYLNLARIETVRGEYERAASLLGDAKEIAAKLRLRALAADVLESEGTLLRETGDFEGARERYARAAAQFTELGHLDVVESLSEEEAILAARRGDHGEADRVASRIVERRRGSGDREGLAWALLALGEILVRGHEPARAVQPLGEAATIFTDLGRAYQECCCRAWQSLACHLVGNAAGARTAAEAALRLSERFDYRATILRIAGMDAGFGRWLGTLPAAPPDLKGQTAQPSPQAATPGRLTGAGFDLTVRLLGAAEVYRDVERKIPARAWKIRRALEVFCFIAASRDRRASKEKIVDALWGETRLSIIEKNFHPTISFLRRALNHGHNVPKNFILYERGAYLLNPAHRYAIDTETFESEVRKARRLAAAGDRTPALEAYDEALAHYRGPFLEEEYGEWTEAPRAHYEKLHLAALDEAGRMHVEAGDRDAGLALLGKRVEHDPLDEQASSALMAALGQTGNRAGVEKEFDRLTRRLLAEIESEPMPETRRAYDRALALATRVEPAKPPPPKASRKGGSSGRRDA